jgi:hypothetical protein
MVEFIYLKLTGLEVSVDMFHYSSRVLCRFGCIILTPGYQRMEITEIGRDREQIQKGNTYNSHLLVPIINSSFADNGRQFI